MSALAAKIRKAREFSAEIEGWKLRLRRPTDAEAVEILRADKPDFLDVARRFVIGWEDVTEAKFITSGASDPLAFDAEAWAEIVPDHPELWQPIADSVVLAWTAHNDRREARSKN